MSKVIFFEKKARLYFLKVFEKEQCYIFKSIWKKSKVIFFERFARLLTKNTCCLRYALRNIVVKESI